MTTEGSSEEGTESGGALREKLEAELAENKALREALATEVVGSFKYVKPEDLSQVAPNELRDRAAQIEQERQAERQDLLKSELAAKGWDEKQIEEFLGNEGTPPPASTSPRPKLDGNFGSPPARPKPGEDAPTGPARIRAALGD